MLLPYIIYEAFSKRKGELGKILRYMGFKFAFRLNHEFYTIFITLFAAIYRRTINILP